MSRPEVGSSANTTTVPSRTSVSRGSSDAGRGGTLPGVSTWLGEGAPKRGCSSLTARRAPVTWKLTAMSALAPRELSVAMLYAQGQSHKYIAATLGLTPATVRTYLRTAYAALGVRNKLELVAALRNA